MNLTAFRSHEFSYVKEELLAIREQVPSAIFKVIIEAPQLTEQEICQAVDLCVEGRADYVKTSTGWYPGCPSTVEQVRIMSREAAGRIPIPKRLQPAFCISCIVSRLRIPPAALI